MALLKNSKILSINESTNGSGELLTVRNLGSGRFVPKMEETSVNVDPCAENQICSSKRNAASGSTTTLRSCSCGPDCGPDKCQRRTKMTLVAWDATRTKIFITLIAAFAIWMLIYIPISLVSMKEDEACHEN